MPSRREPSRMWATALAVAGILGMAATFVWFTPSSLEMEISYHSAPGVASMEAVPVAQNDRDFLIATP